MSRISARGAVNVDRSRMTAYPDITSAACPHGPPSYHSLQDGLLRAGTAKLVSVRVDGGGEVIDVVVD
jgi:hypothetical protein